MASKRVLALYGFRSKQQFIYRTNRIKEITGASELIAGLYDQFLWRLSNRGFTLQSEWRDAPWRDPPADAIGCVVYEGGGNLCMLYANRDAYVQANRIFSRMTFDMAPGLGLIAAGVPSSNDFAADFHTLHQRFDQEKKHGSNTDESNTLPFTLIDRRTFQPIAQRIKANGETVELSRESLAKLKAFRKSPAANTQEGRFIDELIDQKGSDSLIAVIYCDGNGIGQKLRDATAGLDGSYASQINALRQFSAQVHRALVEHPISNIRRAMKALPANRQGLRVVIDHGDEITLIANAHAVPTIVDAYVSAVEESGGYHACAGIALCHSHDPFSEVYRIAEQCCESGKKRNRSVVLSGGADASYIDFHFCRSGITGSLERIRAAQEEAVTLRPYAWESPQGISFQDFEVCGKLFASSNVSRADIKHLGNLALKHPYSGNQDSMNSTFRYEMERLRSKDGPHSPLFEALQTCRPSDAEKLIFDIAGFYDAWFADQAADTKEDVR